MTITISKKEYFDLRLASAKLLLLECGGVDNWEWYGESLYPEDENCDDLEVIEEKLRIEIFGEQKMAKARTGRGKNSKGGAPRHGKRTRSKDMRKARRLTIQNNSRHVKRRLRNALKLINSDTV